MLAQLGSLLIWAVVSAVLWLVKTHHPADVWDKAYYTALAFTGSYFIFKCILEGLMSRPIQDARLKYSFRKTVSILFWAVALVVTVRVWIQNPQALLVAYGLVGAGVAVSLQDFFKNFVGSMSVMMNNIYRVGDRIEINGEFGDVIDIGLMYTTVMELREWVDGDQATGRICTIPNGLVLSHVVNNYTRDHNFIWDEIVIPITYDSDWKLAKNIITRVIKKETKDLQEDAKEDIAKIRRKYFVSSRDVEPSVFMTLTDNWIKFQIRYVTRAHERRAVHAKFSELLLGEIQKSSKIRIASETLTITNLPKRRS